MRASLIDNNKVLSRSGIHYSWAMWIHRNGEASCDFRLSFDKNGTFAVNVSLPISADRIFFFPPVGVNHSWFTDITYRYLALHVAFNESGKSLTLSFRWNASATYYAGQFFFGANEYTPTPKVLEQNNSRTCPGILEIHTPALNFAAFDFITEPVSINSTGYYFLIIYEDQYQLPQFSYIPKDAPDSDGFLTENAGVFELVYPVGLREFALNTSPLIQQAFLELVNRIGLLPLKNPLQLIFLPPPIFHEICPTPGAAAFYDHFNGDIVLQSYQLLGASQGFEYYLHTIVHELVHAFTHGMCFAGMPSVLLEGWAEYFSYQILRDWGFREYYLQHANYSRYAVHQYRDAHNDSLISVWKWDLLMVDVNDGYRIAWWLTDSIANMTPQSTYKRLFSQNPSGWPSVGFIGRTILVGDPLWWGVFDYYLSIAAGISTTGLLQSLDCPLIPYVLVVSTLTALNVVYFFVMIKLQWTRQPLRFSRRRGGLYVRTIRFTFIELLILFPFTIVLYCSIFAFLWWFALGVVSFIVLCIKELKNRLSFSPESGYYRLNQSRR